MAAKIYYSPFIPTFSGNGLPVGSAKLYFYYTGTTTKAPIYSDSGMTTPMANPVISDLAGRYDNIYLDETVTYRVRATTSTGSPIGDDIDPYVPGEALRGPQGPAGNVAADLTALKVSSVDDFAIIYDGSIFQWTLGDFTGKADDATVIKANSTAISVGAWVRQPAEVKTVTDFGADPTGVLDSEPAFNAAAVAAANGGYVVIPRGTYKINNVVDILDGQTWDFHGATLIHDYDTRTMLRADDKSDWSIIGSCLMRGLLVSQANTGEVGLRVTNGKRYKVEGLTARLFKGSAFSFGGGTAGPIRGDRGQFVNCGTHESMIGLDMAAGAGSEYNTWANFCAAGNIIGVKIGAGNNTFVGGNIVDNAVEGVQLIAGANHGHGMFVGVNINHNSDYNVRAISVVNGYTFVGCHFYGNTIGTPSGGIWLDGCKGFVFQGGIIDCWLINDLGTGSGLNKVLDNFFPNDYGVQLFSSNSGLGELYLKGNFLADGESELNDAAPVFISASRFSTPQFLTSGVAATIIFNNELRDKAGDYNSTTGIFTAPVTGFYDVSVTISAGAASGLSAMSYASIIVNNVTEKGYIPIVPLSGTIGAGNGAMTVFMSAGDNLRVYATVTGTTPALATGLTHFSIALR